MNHCMVDIETFGRESNAVVTSIGAVVFDPEKPWNKDEIKTFYARLNVQEQIDRGRTVDASTIEWWLEQDEKARELLYKDKGGDVARILRGLGDFCYNMPLWGNGPTFDNAILRNLYKEYKIKFPTTFRNDTCFRTIKRLALVIDPEYTFKWLDKKDGVAHDPLFDAVNQACCVTNIYQDLLIRNIKQDKEGLLV